MSTAELNAKKLELIAWINKLSDEGIIEFLDGLRNSTPEEDWWDDLSERQQELVKKGLDDADNGRVVSSAEFWNSLKNG